MKTIWILVAAALLAANVSAQTADPLAVTLPNGRVVHFQTEEQKAKFEAARANIATRAAVTPVPPPTPTPQDTPLDLRLGRTALDDKPKPNGIVNTTAPTFTADYYMLAPSSWTGKKVTLAVAYIVRDSAGEPTDGMVRLRASTWNDRPGTGGDQNSGGSITILAAPEVATRLMQQCGTRLQYNNGYRIKVTMIHGEITLLPPQKSAVPSHGSESATATKEYGFMVTN